MHVHWNGTRMQIQVSLHHGISVPGGIYLVAQTMRIRHNVGRNMMQEWHKEVQSRIDYEYTIYKRKLISTKLVPMKKMVMKCNEYRHGPTYHIIESEGLNYIGKAGTWKNDQYRGATGKAVSKGRAEFALAWASNTVDRLNPKYNDYIEELHTINHNGKSISGIMVPRESSGNG